MQWRTRLLGHNALPQWVKAKPSWLRRWSYRHRWKLLGLGLALIAYSNCLPTVLFDTPTSIVLLDRQGQLLGARIAADGQWRFPASEVVPEKFCKAIVAFEDKRFYGHPGVDPLALSRALWLNLTQGKVVSGGSTLSMQVIRLSRKQPRTIWEKVKEMVLATRLEWRHTKEEILALYAAHAPFGGNVVGLEAASWKYYGRRAEQLSWAETCALAVLPNAPGLIHPGKNRDALLSKRNFLLEKLLAEGSIDSTTHQLALLEPLPGRPKALPGLAPHLLDRFQLSMRKTNHQSPPIQTTLEANMQYRANEIVARHHGSLRQNGIHHIGALLIEAETGDVRAYIGNTQSTDQGRSGYAVDMVVARRSTGSILKPFLYAHMLNEGELLPHTLVADVPSYYGGFTPTNYDRTYQGAVPASRALARSLNIPAVRMLQRHGIARFQAELQSLGIKSLDRPSDDYGLTLILGGAEASLWDLGGMYASMARSLLHYTPYQSRYDPHDIRPLNVLQNQSHSTRARPAPDQLSQQAVLSAGAIWHTFQAMEEVNRPDAEGFWRNFGSSHRVAWKTGTSYGFRDAWAIGCTPGYVIAVWVGNADGEGRPGLIGSQAAAPIMFDLFNMLELDNRWFSPPYDDLVQVPICAESGHQPGPDCPNQDSIWIPKAGLRSPACPYHHLVHLDASGQFQVHSECESPHQMQHRPYFVLPPTQERYYRRYHPTYESLPPFRDDCETQLNQTASMELVYPQKGTKIFVPLDLDGKSSRTIFEVSHRRPDARIFWHLDETYLGETRQLHEMGLNPDPGVHTLTLIDEKGESLVREFEIMLRKKPALNDSP